ncbi:iron-siderophore ABC transporter substrate-binding protein [Geomicrobium sp. JCM 19038]|uniref:iron-siderophore ABC transporter substrate-binding protein n=1 Tax=Geomicrobium sp. JCM 19038 TaxID=1460635 RepID=UPI00045F1739|nr:iron-siderophore ABC transporter substrate-binding protein [Geomicrobium sp. JCM 19038]GAK08291.1 iron compound ABC uptake transporter substrate-binding protein PiaA [Geomicrobium sp. JCM 19038]
MKRSHLLFSSALLSLALVACSDESSDTTSATTPEGDGDGEETATPDESADEQIVIEHAFGETVLDDIPERVATVQWGNQDIALALGVEPVGFSAANYGVQDDSGLLPWTKDQLDELGVTDPNIYQDTDGLDFEAISDSNPDVILASYSGITQEDYDLLTQIAPVVAYPTTPWTTPWREQVLMNAEGMGMKAEGEQLIEDTEATIDEALEDYPEIEGKSVVWVNFSADDMSNLHLYTPVDTRVSFLKEELGLSTPEDVEAMIENKDEFFLSLSAENADVLNDADIIIGYGDEELYEAVKADSRLGQIPAIERGSVVMVGNATPLAAAGTPNPLSIEYTIEEYVELIGDAVAKLDE